MSKTELTYQKFLGIPSDIQNHLSTLKTFADKSPRIVELGFRGGVSTSALMAAKPKRLTIIDWDKPPFEIDRNRLRDIIMDGMEQDTFVEFHPQDSLDAWLPESEMLFLDTFHTYEHLFLELMRHSENITNYILIHDTDEPMCPGMFCAVEDFLMDNHQWSILKRITDRPGLTILERIADYHTFEYSQAFKLTLLHEVNEQKKMFYESIGEGGSSSNDWKQYMRDMGVRFRDSKRWPLSNAKQKGATDLMTSL
jgi:hypothetical protein